MYATSSPPLSSEGSELGPFAGLPPVPFVIRVVAGVQPLVLEVVLARHELRKKIPLVPFVRFCSVTVESRFVELDAKTTDSPVRLADGPAVVKVGTPLVHGVPQTPLFACAPEGAISKSTGSPAESEGFTAKVSVFDVPPPGPGLKTCT